MKIFLSVNPYKKKKYNKLISDIEEWTKSNLNIVENISDADTVISLGGDGSLLYSINKYRGNFKFLGINLGHLGFLTSAIREDYKKILKDIFINKNFKEEKISYLKFENNLDEIAINDIVIKATNNKSIIRMNLFIENEFIYKHTGDGLIISTPIGSTAYNLSVNGPILNPTMDSFLINNIAAHSLNVRPIILNEDESVRIEIIDKEASLIIDGRTDIKIKKDLKIFLSKNKISILRPQKWNFYNVLRKKLHWGKRG